MKPNFIILHHSASPITQTAEAINEYHRRKWNFRSELGGYAGYQYIIEHDGRVTQWRKDTERGAHTIGRNHDSIGICIVGWFDDGHDSLPTPEQQESLRELIDKKRKQYGIGLDHIKFHRDYAEKSCPGYHITKDWLYNLLSTNMKKENQEFYDYKKEAQGWDTMEEWVEAAREYRDERDDARKKAETLEEEKSKMRHNYDSLVDRLRQERNTFKKLKEEEEKKFIRKADELIEAKKKINTLENKLSDCRGNLEKAKLEKKDYKQVLESKNDMLAERAAFIANCGEEKEELERKLKKVQEQKQQALEQTDFTLLDLIKMVGIKIREKLNDIKINQ